MPISHGARSALGSSECVSNGSTRVVISDSRSCRLQVGSTITVLFNREKRTAVSNSESDDEHANMTSFGQLARPSFSSSLANANAPASSSSANLANADARLEQEQAQQMRTRPCCFCWCGCFSCSWIRRRCKLIRHFSPATQCWQLSSARQHAMIRAGTASMAHRDKWKGVFGRLRSYGRPKRLSVKAPNGSLDNPADFIKEEDLGSVSGPEVKSWGDSFERLMASEKGRKVFRSFLRCEYSEENILFWLACEELKVECNPELIEEKARIIYEDYVSILSPREVSLDSRVREIINRNMIAPSSHTFDEAQLQIYTLMHRDSYPRFVNSATYKELLRTCGLSSICSPENSSHQQGSSPTTPTTTTTTTTSTSAATTSRTTAGTATTTTSVKTTTQL